MSFLQPFMLWGLLAFSIPIIIHLLNRRRFRTVKWAAMDFLLKATRESRGKKKLKNFIILTCRALAIACLIFALARPLLGGFMGFGASVDTVLLILDRSASMERRESDGQPTKRELILRQVAQAMEELETAKLVILDSATGEIDDVPSPETLPELSTTGPTDTTTDLPSLFTRALDYLREAEPGRTEIWLATDLQLADWRVEDARWLGFARSLGELPSPTSVRVLALPETPRDNHSIRLLSTRRETDELLIELEITREEATTSESLPITLNLNGAPTTQSAQIDGQSLRTTLRAPLPDETASGWGYASLSPDPNLRDNFAYFTYGEQKPLQTLLIHDGSLSTEANRALTRAAAPPGVAGLELTIRDHGEDSLTLDLSDTALLIWVAPMPRDSEAVLISSYLQRGGQVLFLPPGNPDETSFATLAWANALESSPTGRYFIPQNWRQDEGPLRDGRDGSALPVDRLRAIKRLPLSTASDAVPLATWDDGSPLLARKVLGLGTAHLLTTLPDYQWSDLEQTALHLVLVQRLLEEGAKQAGTTLVAGLNESATPETAERLDNATPENSYPLTAGIYRPEGGNGDILALNLPPAELSLAQLQPNEIRENLLPDFPVSFFEQEAASNQSLLTEIWRPFLLGVLFFLLAEAILTLNRRSSSSSKNSRPAAKKKATA
ncbi:MAG: BatA domain-containing protein [Verrucomicrobiota bacterium JB023]|nr:BatA domain-containing protein [Verrucomicrobiota bacterium JB023]